MQLSPCEMPGVEDINFSRWQHGAQDPIDMRASTIDMLKICVAFVEKKYEVASR